MKSFKEYCKLEAEREFDDFDIGPQSDEREPDAEELGYSSQAPERGKKWITKEEAEKLIGNPSMVALVKQGRLATIKRQGHWWKVGEVQGEWYMEPDTSTAGL